MAHTIRQTINKTWPIPRKGTKYVVVPSHNKKSGIPLLILMREMLGVVKTRKELKKILHEEKVVVNSKVAKEENLSLALFDTLKLKALDKYYMVSFSKIGKIALVEISEKDCEFKISKVIDKKILKGGKVQINLYDGRNFLYDKEIKVGDSVLINLDSKKIENIIHISENSEVMVIKGKHLGQRGKVVKVEEEKALIQTKQGEVEIKLEELIALK